MQKHIHGAKRPSLRIQLLPVDSHLSAGHFLIGFKQKATTAASRVIDTVVLFRPYQPRHQFRDLTWSEILPAFLACIGSKVGDHVFVGIADNVCGTQLAGAEIKIVEILQKIAESRVLFLNVSEIDLRVEINGAEHIAELAAVVLLDTGKCDINLLADFVIVAVFVEKIKARLLIDNEAFAAHGSLNANLVAVILLHVPVAFFVCDIAQVFHKQH